MELAAKKREPKVKKLPIALDYRRILSKNEKIRGRSQFQPHREIKEQRTGTLSTPEVQIPDIKRRNDQQRSNRDTYRKRVQESTNLSSTSATKVNQTKSVNKPGLKSPVGENISNSNNRKRIAKHKRDVPGISGTTDARNDMYYGEIQVKANEQDEENRFEMLVMVHDDDDDDGNEDRYGEPHPNVTRVKDVAVGPSFGLEDNYSCDILVDDIDGQFGNFHNNHHSHDDEYYISPTKAKSRVPGVSLDAMNQFELLHTAQRRNEQIIEAMKSKSSIAYDDSDSTDNLELEALDTIQDTLSTAINVCDFSLLHSEKKNINIKHVNLKGMHHPPPATAQGATYQELLLEEKRQLLLQWKKEEKKRVLDEEVSALENEVKEKIQLKEEHMLQMELQNKRLEQLTIVEELRQHEMQRLKAERELKLAADERAQRKKARMEQKVINSRISAFLESQEETLERLKAERQRQWEIGGRHDEDNDHGYRSLSPVQEEDDDVSNRRPRLPLSKRGDGGPRSASIKAPTDTTRIGHERNKYGKTHAHDWDKNRGGEYMSSDIAERRRERNEYYRAQQAEKDRLKQQELRDIQERLNPGQFQVQFDPDRKRRSKQSSGKKGINKKVAPATDYSSVLSRNRKVRQKIYFDNENQ
jgi:hypothetical protein